MPTQFENLLIRARMARPELPVHLEFLSARQLNAAPKEQSQAPVEILLPLPPQLYGTAAVFQKDKENHDQQAVENSRAQLANYRADYPIDGVPYYPLRVHVARQSGLPAFVNGYLDHPAQFSPDEPEAGTKIALTWLEKQSSDEPASKKHWSISGVLFGRKWGKVAEKLHFINAVFVQWPDKVETPKHDGWKGQLCGHVRFQQFLNDMPVFGGQVVVHLRRDDTRVSCSNSYLPLRDHPEIKRPENYETARNTARRAAIQAVIGELEGEALIGLALEWFAPWMDPNLHLPESDWTKVDSWVAENLIKSLLEQDSDRYKGLAKFLPQAPHPFSPHAFANALREYMRGLDNYAWRIEFLRYANAELMVYPFAGKYHCACWLELAPPGLGPNWRVFVDANNGTLLGAPDNNVLHAPVFLSSDEAFIPWPQNAPPMPQGTGESVADLQNQVQVTDHYVELHDYNNGQKTPLNLAALNVNSLLLLEGANIAHHARELFKAFQDPCDLGCSVSLPGANGSVSASARIQSGSKIRAIVGVPPGVGGSDEYSMAFGVNAATQTGEITFQTMALNDANGLRNNDNRANPAVNPFVFAPSLDPEIILHEFAHAFMWKLELDPAFGMDDAQRPFIHPLLEGYATYFARSIGARAKFDAQAENSFLWACAAFRRGNWGELWDMRRGGPAPVGGAAYSPVPGADVLTFPNVYPRPQASGLQAYEVSMLWARALWEIAFLLAPAPIGNLQVMESQADRIVAFKAANRLAISSYLYLHGLTANYELAAEGIVDTAINLQPHQVNAIKAALAGRGIFAEQGVQTLVETAPTSALPSQLFIGSDQGAALWDSAVNWSLPMRGADEIAVVGDAVGMAADDTDLYVATESQVWKSPLGNAPNWSRLGNFPAEIILSFAEMNAKLVLGTSESIWGFWNNTWNQFAIPLPIVRMNCLEPPSSNNQALLAATLTETLILLTHAQGGGVGMMPVILPTGTRATCATLFGNALYVGTMNGILRWANITRATLTTTNLTSNPNLPTSESLGGAGVLCLFIDHGIAGAGNARIGAGTTSGLYWRDAAWGTWALDPNQPPGAKTGIVNAISWGSKPAIGTLNNGLYVFENGGWQTAAI